MDITTTGDIMSMNDSWREWISVLFNRVATGAAIIIHVLLKDSFRSHIAVGLAFPRKLGSEQSWLKQLKSNWPDLARVTRWPAEACSRVLVKQFPLRNFNLMNSHQYDWQSLESLSVGGIHVACQIASFLKQDIRCGAAAAARSATEPGSAAAVWKASSKWNDTRFTTNSRAGTLEPWAMLLPCNSRVSCGWDFTDICSHLNMSMGLSYMYIYTAYRSIYLLEESDWWLQFELHSWFALTFPGGISSRPALAMLPTRGAMHIHTQICT